MTHYSPFTVQLAKSPRHCIMLQGTLTKATSPIPRTPSDSQVSQRPVQGHGKRSHPMLTPVTSLLASHARSGHCPATITGFPPPSFLNGSLKSHEEQVRAFTITWGHKGLSYERKKKKIVAPGDLLSSPRLAQVGTVFWKHLFDT